MSVEDKVNYGLEKINPSEKVAISLKDLMLIFKTFEELNAFFHQPANLESIDNIKKFIGNKNSGMYHIISQNYYRVIPRILPESIKSLIDAGEFSCD